jgi:hypothetical protein
MSIRITPLFPGLGLMAETRALIFLETAANGRIKGLPPQQLRPVILI